MGTDRRSDLDKAYKILINALFDSINRLSEEHPKTPRSVVLLGKGERERERVQFLDIHIFMYSSSPPLFSRELLSSL